MAGVPGAAPQLPEPRVLTKAEDALFAAARDWAPGLDGGYTVLHEAAQHGCVGVIDTLLGAGSPVDAVGSDWCTPLHVAVSFGNIDAARALLRANASVDGVDGCRRGSPLSIAAAGGKAQGGNVELTNLL